jgi:hypothetical protein
VRSIHSKVGTVAQKRIRVPPMVGVPCFFSWDSGPSSRTSCPMAMRRSQRMNAGPSQMDNRSENTAASRMRADG